MSKYLAKFFCLSSFLNIKKSILANFKTPGTVSLLIPFSNIKKSTLINLKIPGTVFCLSPFQILKKDTHKS